MNTAQSLTHRVVMLDDDDAALRLLGLALQQYPLQAFRHPDAFMQQLPADASCILLDVQLPGHNGYDICRRLREQPATRHVPVIFVSGQGSLEDRLAGYSAGGDDFVTKPFDLEELRAKVERALQHQAHTSELQCGVDDARQTAFEAMTHSAEQGEISRFIEQLSTCRNASELGNLLIGTLKNFGLNAVVAFWHASQAEYVSHAVAARPLEAELLRTCRDGRRIIEMEKRLLVNMGLASLLIKNAPWQDAMRYGRIKDHVCVLMSGVDARLRSLQTEQRCLQQEQLLLAVDDIRTTLARLQHDQEQRLQQAAVNVEELELELAEELLLLNLDADQEQHLQQLVRHHISQLQLLYRQGADVRTELEPVLQALAAIAGSR